jgi:hypothetical protein
VSKKAASHSFALRYSSAFFLYFSFCITVCKYSGTSNNGHCQGISVLSVTGGVS